MVTYTRALLDQEITAEEGCELRWYYDTRKVRTIGIGRNLDAIGIRQKETEQFGITLGSVLTYGITEAEALAMLDNDIPACEAALDAKLPWWRQLSDVRQRVLLQMVFQMGIAGVLKFKLALAAMQRGAWAVAKNEMLNSDWAKQTPARAQRLAKRMETGATA